MKYELINVMNGKVVASVNDINTARMLQHLAKETTYISKVKIS